MIRSNDRFTIYLLGDLESLLDSYPTEGEALMAFETWAASNTTDHIPVIRTSD